MLTIHRGKLFMKIIKTSGLAEEFAWVAQLVRAPVDRAGDPG